MRALTYMGVFEPGDDSGYSVYFPDLPGCISCGDDFEETQHMATEALGLHIYGMERDGDVLPAVTLPPFEEMPEGGIVVPITVYPDIIKNELDTRAIVTSITLPSWLKDWAEMRGINLSQVLQTTLMQMCGINNYSNRTNQSFSVDDIRRIRDEDSIRYQGMTSEEISKDIHERAQEGYRIIERIRCEKEAGLLNGGVVNV